MTTLTVDLDKLLSAANVIDQIFIEVEFSSELIGIGNLKLGAEQHIALIGLELTEQQLDQRGFAGAVTPHNTDTVTPLDNGGKIGHHRLLVIAERDASRFSDASPRAVGFL